jgi:HK97 family phage portal protein
MVNWVRKLLRWHGDSNAENPANPATWNNIYNALAESTPTTSGEAVGPHTALTYSPVWAAVDIITSDVSRLPWKPYRDTNDGRELLREHPVYTLTCRMVDEYTPTQQWMICILAQALLYGNGYAVIRRGRAVGGRRFAAGLEHVNSDQVEVIRRNGTPVYRVKWNVTENGRADTEEIQAANMFHLRGLSLEAHEGLSLIGYARNTIGRQLAAEHYGDDFFKNGAIPDGFFSHPGQLTQLAQERFLLQMERRHMGAGRRHRLGFLEEDMKWVATGITPRDAMLLDQLKWGIPDVARFFSIPAHKLGDPSRQGWNTTEQENISYYNSTLGKWTSRFVSESQKLFDGQEQRDHYTAFDLDDLIKADMQGRYMGYGLGIQWGFLTRNDVRRKENLPPLPGLDEPLTPVNMTTNTDGAPPAAALPAPAADDDVDDDADDELRQRVHQAQVDLVYDQILSAVRVIFQNANRAASEPRRFLAWLNGIEAEEGRRLTTIFRPVAGLLGAIHASPADTVLQAITAQFVGTCRDRILVGSEVPAEDLKASIEATQELVSSWGRQAASDWITKGVQNGTANQSAAG